jgi:hypothetical protein
MHVNCRVPESVRAIDLSFNKLRSIAYDLVPQHVRITASFCFLTQVPPPPFDNTMIYDHNDIVYSRYTAERHFRMGPPAFKSTAITVYNDAQNVHASSVQQSTNTSLEYILKYESKNQETLLPHLVIKDIHSAYRRYKAKKSLLCCFLPWWLIPSLPLEVWCNDRSIHSIPGITYKTLLQQVWAIIQDHPERHELEMILCEELDASRDVCFTGRFTRTLNALSGFVEGVCVGISPREQMQNQIAKAIETCRNEFKDADKFMVNAKERVSAILNEFSVGEHERDAWLDAIE